MKTLILTSSGSFITRYNIDQYLPKKITDCKIAYITTAGNKVFDISYLERHKSNMDKLGFDYNEMDITGKSENDLKEMLKGYDIIYVEGGNTYHLLNEVRKSGFENVVRELLEKGVIYIGSSAGSYIATPSIVTANWIPRGYDKCGITDYTGMNLIPFIIKAHSVQEKLDLYKEKSKNLKSPIRFLNDDQAFLIQDDDITLIGDGEEIVLR